MKSRPLTKKAIVRKTTSKSEDSSDPSVEKILKLLRSKTKTEFTGYKITTMKRRVHQQMALHNFKSFDEYEKYLTTHPEALMELQRALLIHVTDFFRNEEIFDYLQINTFPLLLNKPEENPAIRIWIAGCSTGEEAYSFAMSLLEYFEKKTLRPKIQIFATDVSEASVNFARRGVYPKDRLGNVSKKRLKRFFDESGDGYKVKKDVRDLCVFSTHDITSSPPFAKLDIVSCRNVLIYFSQDLQKKVLPIFHYALKPNGILVLGQSESVGTKSTLFRALDKKNKIYQRLISGDQPRLNLNTYTSLSIPKDQLSYKNDGLKSADQVMLSRYAPPAAIINSELEIVQFRGRTSPYLEPPKGQPTNQLLKMAHPDLVSSLRTLIRTGVKNNEHTHKSDVKIEIESISKSVDLEMVPLNPSAPEKERQYLIIFEEETKAKKKKKPAVSKVKKHKDLDIANLLKEMEDQQDVQQTIIEQFEATQEELTSANEELQATNEELQSTNEELETAKEELQAANEELTTMNNELHERNHELRALNDKLIRSEERFRRVVEAVYDYAIFTLDVEGHVTSWNEGARRFKGYEASEILGSSFTRFYTPSDLAQEKPYKLLKIAIEKGKVEDEGWRVRKDGTMFWANVIITRLNDSNGEIMGFTKVTRDLTEKRQTEEALRRSEERFRLMVSAVKDYAIIMLDVEGNIVSWNEGAKRIKGYESSDILGCSFKKFYSAEDIARNHPENELRIALKEGKYEEEAWRIRKDGTRFWANVIITSIIGTEGQHLGFVKVTRDLTERKQNEEKIKLAYQDLEQKVKERTKELEIALSSRDEFLSIASHELNTPLTSLKLQMQMTNRKVNVKEGKLPTAQELSRSLDIGLRQVNTLSDLVEDLLELSRIQSGWFKLNLTDFDLAELVEEVVSKLSTQAGASGNVIEFKVIEEFVHWDRKRIGQVLMNFISNAIKYAPGSPILIEGLGKDEDIVLSIQDFGPGISKDKQAKIFERFERGGVDRNVTGLGLGLFITKRIVEGHGGKIHVESEIDKGSKFIVRIPRISKEFPTS